MKGEFVISPDYDIEEAAQNVFGRLEDMAAGAAAAEPDAADDAADETPTTRKPGGTCHCKLNDAEMLWKDPKKRDTQKPVVVVKVNGKPVYKTDVATSTAKGTNPVFNDEFDFKVGDWDDRVNVIMYEHINGKDKFRGSLVNIKASRFCAKVQKPFWGMFNRKMSCGGYRIAKLHFANRYEAPK